MAHLSDIHLGHRQYGLEERLEDYNKAFLRAVDELLRLHEEEGLEHVIISGDLFDTQRPPPSIYITAIRGFMRLREAGMRIYAVRGNHDASIINPTENPLVVLHQMGLINYMDDGHVDIDNVRLIGVGTVYTDMQNKLFTTIRNHMAQGRLNIAIIHQYIEGAPYVYPMPNVDVFMVNEKPLLQLNLDYIAVGHIHEHGLKHPRLNATYPGSLEIWDAREFETFEYRDSRLSRIKGMDPKGFLILDVGSNGVRVRSIALKPQRRLVRIRMVYDEAKPDRVRGDVSYIANNMDLRDAYIILEIEGKVARGYSSRDFQVQELRRFFTKSWVDVRLNLERPQRVVEEVRTFSGINDIIRTALRSKLNDENLVSSLMDIIEKVRVGNEDGAFKTLEDIVGVPLRGSRSIRDWLG